MCVCLRTCARACTSVDIRGQLAEVSSLFLMCGSVRRNSVCQAWWQVPRPTEPSHWLADLPPKSLLMSPILAMKTELIGRTGPHFPAQHSSSSCRIASAASILLLP